MSDYDFETDFDPFRVSFSNTPHRGFNFDCKKSTELDNQSVASLNQIVTRQKTDRRKPKHKPNDYHAMSVESSPCRESL